MNNPNGRRDVKSTRLVGVDLGQQRDWTAINITERVVVATGEIEKVEQFYDRRAGYHQLRRVEKTLLEYRVRHLERPELGTSYPDMVERIVELLKALSRDPYNKPASRVVLAVDGTGAGRPVVDMLRGAIREDKDLRWQVRPVWITITGGDSVNHTPDGWLRVPKRDLISAPLVLMQNKQLKIADARPLKDTLVKELLSFRVKINISTAHDSYEAWREGDHDDLVLSVALSCWAGERFSEAPLKLVRKPAGF
jgi:hypothetical protein